MSNLRTVSRRVLDSGVLGRYVLEDFRSACLRLRFRDAKQIYQGIVCPELSKQCRDVFQAMESSVAGRLGNPKSYVDQVRELHDARFFLPPTERRTFQRYFLQTAVHARHFERLRAEFASENH